MRVTEKTIAQMNDLKAFVDAGGSVYAWAKRQGMPLSSGGRIWTLVKKYGDGSGIDRGCRDKIAHLLRTTDWNRERIAELCGVSGTHVGKVMKEIGVSRRLKPEPAPEGFAELAATTPTNVLAERYNRPAKRIRGWRKMVGVEYAPPKAPKQAKPQAVTVAAPRKAPQRFIAGLVLQAVTDFKRDMTLEGRAADWMQRDRWVCFRCTADGRAMPGTGSHWRLGSLVVTGEELVERARRKGFEARAAA